MSLRRAFTRGRRIWTPTTDWEQLRRLFGGQLLYREPFGAGSSFIDTRAAANFVLDGTDIIVAKDCSRSVADPTLNGGFETGDPPTDWTAGSGATLSQQSGTRTGGSGSYVMRVAIPIADADGRGIQTCVTAGQRYLVDGWGRGDTVNGVPYIKETTVHWLGTSSATWQNGVAVFNAVGTDLWLGVTGNVATADYTEFDDIVITPGNHAYQATSANRPTYDSGNKCMTFTAASSEYLSWIAPPSTGYFGAWVWINSTAANNAFVGSRDGSGYWMVLEQESGADMRVLWGGSVYTYGSAMSQGAWHYAAMRWQPGDISIWLDGVKVSYSATKTASTRDWVLGARDNIGSLENYLDGRISTVHVASYAISDAMHDYLYRLGRT